MKILFYNHSGHISGAEKVILLALKHLDREKYTPVMICPDGDLSAEAHALGVKVRTIWPLQARFTLNPLRLALYLSSVAGTVLEFRKLIAKESPDLLHANSIRAGI